VLCGTRLHSQHGDGLRYGLVHIVDQYRALVGKLQQNDRHNATVPPHTQTLDPEFPAERVKQTLRGAQSKMIQKQLRKEIARAGDSIFKKREKSARIDIRSGHCLLACE
jgi:hypothetical protein